MARAKNVTSAQVGECAMKAEDASEIAILIKDAVDKCQIENVEHAKTMAKKLLVASRDLMEAGIALMNQHDLQEMRRSVSAK